MVVLCPMRAHHHHQSSRMRTNSDHCYPFGHQRARLAFGLEYLWILVVVFRKYVLLDLKYSDIFYVFELRLSRFFLFPYD